MLASFAQLRRWLGFQAKKSLKSNGTRAGATIDQDFTRPVSSFNSNPQTLAHRYQTPASIDEIRECFAGIRQRIFERVSLLNANSNDPQFLREFGRLQHGVPYFYIQRFNENGYLFESTDTGWVVVRASKILTTGTFMRAYNLWDRVAVFVSIDGEHRPRVNSDRYRLNLGGVRVYAERLTRELFDFEPNLGPSSTSKTVTQTGDVKSFFNLDE